MTKISTSPIGHQRQIDYFNRVIEHGGLAHAYLFYGVAHLGKKTLAGWLSEKLNIIPLILDSSHPLLPKKNEGTKISIEDICELRRQNSLRPDQGQWRVIIIDEADTMSEQAANAFLKLLEEPGAKTLFILISETHESILPTITSRAQSIRFSPLPDAEMLPLLAGKNITDYLAKKFLSIASGRPGILVQLCQDPSFAAQELSFFEQAANIFRTRDCLSALTFAARAAGDDTLRIRAIEYCLRYLRKELLQSPSDQVRIKTILPRIQFVDQCLTMLSASSVNPRLIMDAVFLETLKPNHI